MTRGGRTVRWAVLGALVALVVWGGRELIVWHPEAARLLVTSIADLERELAAMREPLEIPGMSAAFATPAG
jgi:hypothetical protein